MITLSYQGGPLARLSSIITMAAHVAPKPSTRLGLAFPHQRRRTSAVWSNADASRRVASPQRTEQTIPAVHPTFGNGGQAMHQRL